MDREQMLKLLKKGKDPLDLSIQKWRDIVDGKGEDFGIDNCALCELYNQSSCNGCPVKKKTGTNYCRGSPYEEIDALDSNHPIPKELALKELKFLKSLKEAQPRHT